jgi:hypothetical protein
MRASNIVIHTYTYMQLLFLPFFYIVYVTKSSSSSSSVFATGYDGDEAKSESEIFTFFGGVTPTEVNNITLVFR